MAEEYYTGRDVIRAYNHEAESINNMEKAVDELRVATKKTEFLQNAMSCYGISHKHHFFALALFLYKGNI